MRLLINAVGRRAGGGLTGGLNCIRGIRQVRPDYEIMALVPGGHGYEELCARLSIPHRAFAKTRGYAAWRLWFDQVAVPLAARRWRADVLFTMNNQPAWAAPCPQIVLFANPYYIYPAAGWPPLAPFDRASLRLQRLLFAVCAPRCACVAAQTAVAARRLQEQYGIDPSRVAIVRNAVAAEHDEPETEAGRRLASRMREAAGSRVPVLTVARYYAHKNLEFVVRVAQRLRETEGPRFVFFITIDPDQHPGARAVLETIERAGLGGDVINLGPLGYGELRSVYQAAQICFAPTVLESMSGSYLEALHHQLPIVTTDYDFSRDACGSEALYFPAGDVDTAIRLLQTAAASPPRRQEDARHAKPRPWTDVCRDLTAAIESIARSAPAPDSAVRARGR